VSLQLYGYQQKALVDLTRAWTELRRSGVAAPHLLLVSRTGTGKTVIAGEFLARVRARGKRSLFIVRDRTLLDQTSRHLDRVGITDHGVIAAGHRRERPDAPVQVCSAQTITAREAHPPGDVLVFDEAHGIVCDTSFAIAAAYPDATILGLTATPIRGDKKPLGAPHGVFHRLVQVEATFDQLVAQGALVDCTVISTLSGKPSDTYAMDPIAAVRAYGPGHKVVVFGRDRKHASELAQGAAAAGFRAASVHGESKDREDLLDRIGLPPSDPRALDVLANCDLLTQGWDCPPVDTIVLARGVTSWQAWMQICGRGLRPIPPHLRATFAKTEARIIDLRGCLWKHGHPAWDWTFALEGAAVRLPEGERLALTYCMLCGATYRREIGPACPRCGARMPPKPQRATRVKLAPMAAIDRDTAQMQRKEARFVELVRECVRKGHKPRWVGFAFRQEFGHWPKWAIDAAVWEAAALAPAGEPE